MVDHPSIRRAYGAAVARDPGETSFLQALETFYDSLPACLEEHPRYETAGLLERLGEPERTVLFPVHWTDRQGRSRQARGIFIQYSTVLGPCRGSLTFRPGLDTAALKALALKTTLENSLAGLPLGGGAFGADVSSAGWDSAESLSFCQGFMEGLFSFLPRPFSPTVWAGQISRRELYHLTGQYERLTKLLPGSGESSAPAETAPLSRSHATGHGLCIFAELAFRQAGLSGLTGQTVLISGRDGPAPWAGEQAARLGARVLALGDGAGYLYARDGLPLALLRQMAAQPGLPLLLWAIRAPGVEYRPGPGLWGVPADAVFLCDRHARLDADAARQVLVRPPAGIFEGVPRACTALAAKTLSSGELLYAPAIAAGAGGDIMTFRQQYTPLTRWEAGRQLRAVMEAVFQTVWDESARIGRTGDLGLGARIAAFHRIADAMLAKQW